jgi:hypothetical protein
MLLGTGPYHRMRVRTLRFPAPKKGKKPVQLHTVSSSQIEINSL